MNHEDTKKEQQDVGPSPDFLFERGTLMLEHIREMRSEHRDQYNEAISMFAAAIRHFLAADTKVKWQMPASFVKTYEELAEWVDETLIPEEKPDEGTPP